MKTKMRSGFRAALAAAASLLALPLLAATPIGFVPADAAAVGVVHVDRVRSSALAARLFHEADGLTVEGDAARFLKEADVDPRRDVDTIVFALVPSDGKLRAVVALGGRFDGQRLSRAIEERGGVAVTSGREKYFRLRDPEGKRSDRPGAVAVVGSDVVLAGEESAVARALAEPGTGLHVAGELGREAARLDREASAWVAVDAARTRRWRERDRRGGDSAAAGLAQALDKMSLMSFEATPEGDAVAVAAAGYSADEETRRDLADVLRGFTAAWRLAAQSKSPEALAMVRRIRVTESGDAVRISGKLPAELFEDRR